MDAFTNVARVLCIAGLVVVLLVFWQRDQIKKFALSRAGRVRAPSHKQFWISLAAGVVVFSLLPYFFQLCTGFHLPLTIRMLISLGMFAVFVAFSVLAYFVIEKHRARHPEGYIRIGFVLVAIAGIFFVVALCFYYLGHP